MTSRIFVKGRIAWDSLPGEMKAEFARSYFRISWLNSPIIVCVACGAWVLFWKRAAARGWKCQTFTDGVPHVLCRECYREQE